MASTKQKTDTQTTAPPVEEINWDGVNKDAQDPVSLMLPLVMWRHGKEEMEQLGETNLNYTGGFFFSRDGAGADTKIPLWSEASFKGDDGKVVGLGASVADIALVRARKRWFRNGESRTEFRAWNNYEPGMRGHVQFVGFIKGFEHPVTFTFKGLLQRAVDDVLREHMSKVLSLINRTAPKGSGLPPYALWVRVKSGKHYKEGSGQKQSEVTMPEIVLPKVIDEAFARSRFVGNENLRRFQELYFEAAGWVREWDYAGGEGLDAKKLAHEFQKNPTGNGDAYDVPAYAGEKQEDDEVPF